VKSVKVIKDEYSGRSKGFGFIEMTNKAEGDAAINGLNNTEIKGRAIKVMRPILSVTQGQWWQRWRWKRQTGQWR
jgi:RNA recognition motif-containing protein